MLESPRRRFTTPLTTPNPPVVRGAFLQETLMSFSSIRRSTQPDFEPLSLSEVKSHLRIMPDMKDDDQYLMGLIAAARIYFENRVGQTTTLIQWRAKTKGWNSCSCVGKELPYPPLYVDENHPITLSYEDDACNTVVVSEMDINHDDANYPGTVNYTGPSPGCDTTMTIEWWAGVDAPMKISQLWKSCMLVLIGHWYENRSAVSTEGGGVEVPMSFDMMAAGCSYDGRA